MIAEAFYLVTWQAVLTAVLSGVALGWTFWVIRPGISARQFVRSGTAIWLLWYIPVTAQRLLDPALFPNGVRTFGPALLFELFILTGGLYLAFRTRREVP